MSWRLPLRFVCIAWLALTAGCRLADHPGAGGAGPDPVVASWMEPAGPARDVAAVAALDADAWRQGSAARTIGYTRQAVWFRVDVTLPRDGGQADWVIEFQEPLLNALDVYLPRAPAGGAGWQLVPLGNHLPFAARPLASRNFALPLDWAPGSSATLYVRVRSGTSVHLPTRLLTREQLRASDTRTLLIDAAFIGLMAGLLLYNLQLVYRARERLYYYYSGWLLMIALFVLGMDGMSFQYFWPDAPWLNDYAIVLSLLLSTFLLVGFWMRSTGDHIRHRRLPNDRLWLACMLAAALAVGIAPYQLAIQATIVFTLACALAQLWAAIEAGRNGLAGMRALVFSYTPLLIAGHVLALQRFGLFEYSFPIKYAVAIGAAFQSVMLSALLGDRLSRMRELNAAASEMKRYNRSLSESNAALEASNSALREALQVSEARSRSIAEMKEKLRLAAEHENSEKSKFLAQAVHDLKQPLQAISIAVTPLQSMLGPQADRRVVELIDVIQRASQVMRNQISGLLDLSRLQSGLIRAQMETFPLHPFVVSLLEQHAPNARSRGVDIELEATVDNIQIRSDPSLLGQILGHLLSNAIKYADPAKAPKRKVSIAWHRQDGTLAIVVADNGIGIEESHLAGNRIFQPFFQAHNNLPEGEKGAGLGLSIVKAAVASLPDHHIAVESEFGQGSRFTLLVPEVAPGAARPFVRAANGQLNPAGLADKYVILVDDDWLIRRSIVALLEHHGIVHEKFDSFADFAAHLPGLERRPDILLTDYRLPDDKSALDVMDLLDQAWPGVPTLVISGDADAAATVAGRDHVVGIMHKPVSTSELFSALSQACTMNESGDETSV